MNNLKLLEPDNLLVRLIYQHRKIVERGFSVMINFLVLSLWFLIAYSSTESDTERGRGLVKYWLSCTVAPKETFYETMKNPIRIPLEHFMKIQISALALKSTSSCTGSIVMFLYEGFRLKLISPFFQCLFLLFYACSCTYAHSIVSLSLCNRCLLNL